MSRLTNLPNIITLCRLALAPVLVVIAWRGYSFLFISLLAFCFFTDALDGFIARTWNLQTKLGAKLDSLADFIIYITIPICAWLLWPEVICREMYYVIAIVLSILLPVFTGIIKFGSYPSYHTICTKIAAIGMAVASIFLFSGGSSLLFHIAVFVCVIAAIEEILITIYLSKPQSDVRSIYHLLKAEKNN